MFAAGPSAANARRLTVLRPPGTGGPADPGVGAYRARGRYAQASPDPVPPTMTPWAPTTSPASTGAEMRLTGRRPTGGRLRERRPGARGRGHVERFARVARRRLAPRFPGAAFAEVRYRIKSWKRLDACIADAARPRSTRSARADAAARLLDGRRGRDLAATSRRSSACSGSRRGSPTGSRSSRSAASGSTSSTARSTAGCPGIPGVSPTCSRRGFERARALGVDGTYALIPGALHGIALRAHWRPRPLPRAGRGRGSSRELELAAAELNAAPLELRGVGHLHVPDEPEPLERRGSPTTRRRTGPGRDRAAPRRGRRGGCCASPRRRRAARRAGCSAPRRASGSPGARTCGRSSSR